MRFFIPTDGPQPLVSHSVRYSEIAEQMHSAYMDDSAGDVPLLPNGSILETSTPRPSLKWALAALLRCILRVLMWAVLIFWVAIIFVSPNESTNYLVEKLIADASNKTFGIAGGIFLIYGGPVIIIAFLASAMLVLAGPKKGLHQHDSNRNSDNKPKLRMRTLPILVDGPFGVVSAVEFIGILLFSLFIVWAACAYTETNLSLLKQFHVPSELKLFVMLELSGLRLGTMGLYCLAFLFLPVARGSVLLRVIDVPFEQAARYHVWLGHLTMALFTLHGLFFVVAWAMQGRLLQDIIQWSNVGIAVLPGVISLAAGLLMWATSLSPVRKSRFELFFYTHQLYVVFVVFFALHVGDFIFCIAAAGIFLFILDRFLRFCQSRGTIDVISASSFPCGTVELVLSKPRNLTYNALCFIFLQVRELSWLQWHPFSVSSSPLAGKDRISVLIKVLGEWTAKLEDLLFQSQLHHRSSITASVEGPYGHELPYHLTYQNLVLVAGGIGVSPFFAILSDILRLVRNGQPCRPKDVLLIWAVKRSDELSLLSVLDMDLRCPFLSDKLNLEVQIYVTRESEPLLEEGRGGEGQSTSPYLVFPARSGHCMSVLVGTGNSCWAGAYIIFSVLGCIVLIFLAEDFYINPYNISSWWLKGLIFVSCMVLSVATFGLLVILLWRHWGNTVRGADSDKEFVGTESDDVDCLVEHGSFLKSTRYGSRPDFTEIFGSVAKRWGEVDIGVIVCGPSSLQSSVARECRWHSLGRIKNNSPCPIFHFNSHSFDL